MISKYNNLSLSQDASTIKFIDLKLRQAIATFTADGLRMGEHTRCSFSPDGQYIACGSTDGSIFLWNTRTLKREEVPKMHSSAVPVVKWHPMGQAFISLEKSKKFYVWSDVWHVTSCDMWRHLTCDGWSQITWDDWKSPTLRCRFKTILHCFTGSTRTFYSTPFLAVDMPDKRLGFVQKGFVSVFSSCDIAASRLNVPYLYVMIYGNLCKLSIVICIIFGFQETCVCNLMTH